MKQKIKSTDRILSKEEIDRISKLDKKSAYNEIAGLIKRGMSQNELKNLIEVIVAHFSRFNNLKKYPSVVYAYMPDKDLHNPNCENKVRAAFVSVTNKFVSVTNKIEIYKLTFDEYEKTGNVFEVIKTVFHELRHAYQENITPFITLNNKLNNILDNITNNKENEVSFRHHASLLKKIISDLYFIDKFEKDARDFSYEETNLLFEPFMNNIIVTSKNVLRCIIGKINDNNQTDKLSDLYEEHEWVHNQILQTLDNGLSDTEFEKRIEENKKELKNFINDEDFFINKFTKGLIDAPNVALTAEILGLFDDFMKPELKHKLIEFTMENKSFGLTYELNRKLEVYRDNKEFLISFVNSKHFSGNNDYSFLKSIYLNDFLEVIKNNFEGTKRTEIIIEYARQGEYLDAVDLSESLSNETNLWAEFSTRAIQTDEGSTFNRNIEIMKRFTPTALKQAHENMLKILLEKYKIRKDTFKSLSGKNKYDIVFDLHKSNVDLPPEAYRAVENYMSFLTNEEIAKKIVEQNMIELESEEEFT